MMIIGAAVLGVAFLLFIAAFYYRYRKNRQINEILTRANPILVELGINHIQKVIIRWMGVNGMDLTHYEEEYANPFFTAYNFEVFYVDVESRRIAIRLAADPLLYSPTHHREDASTLILHPTEAGFVAVYESAPIYYNTMGLGPPDSLHRPCHFRETVVEEEFLRLHPNAFSLINKPNII